MLKFVFLVAVAPFSDTPPEGSTSVTDRTVRLSAARVDREPADATMHFFVLRTLRLILEAHTTVYDILVAFHPHNRQILTFSFLRRKSTMDQAVREHLFEYLLTKLSTANTLRR